MTTEPMVRTQAGNYLPAASFGVAIGPQKKFLLVLQYFEGDRESAESLAQLIADLERIRSKNVDVLVYGRNDAMPFSPDTIGKLRLKFNKVIEQKCGRTDAKGYPFGSNGMFYEMVTMFGQQAQWLNNYYAFLNLEPDCCPLGPGWLGKLTEEFLLGVSEDKYALGYIHNEPVVHLNGVAVYSTDIWRRVPGGALGGGNPNITYDIRQAKNLMPFARHTTLMHFAYRKPTITHEELFVEGVVLYHGVKDGSARELVRAKHITHSADRDASRKAIFTFFNPENELTNEEAINRLALWQQGWTTRGWNPVVLRAQEAMRNGRYTQIMEAVDKFPRLGNVHAWRNLWLRYLALDTVGGGLYSETHALPISFAPSELNGMKGFVSMAAWNGVFYSDRAGLGLWFDEILNYAVQETDLLHRKPHVADFNVLQKFVHVEKPWAVADSLVGRAEAAQAKAFTFTDTPNVKKKVSERMETFLKNS